MPPWVIPAIIFTFLLFSCFTIVQWCYQRKDPRYYWETEIWYSALSLTSKLGLGLFLYMNVLRFATFDEATA